MLSVDAMLNAKIDVLLAHVLPTLVITCSLDVQAQGVFSICFEELECIALALEVSHGPKTRGIVNKHHPTPVALRCAHWERPLEVCVDESKANKVA